MDPKFNTWKFWLSSAVLFTGVLTVGLIPGCANGEELRAPISKFVGSKVGYVDGKTHLPANPRQGVIRLAKVSSEWLTH